MPQTHATPTAAPARPQLGHSRRATHAGQYRAAKSPQELAEMRAAFSLSEALLISSDAFMDDGRRVLSPECQRAVNAARACAPTAASQWLGVILAHSARFKTTACTNQVVRDGCCRYEVEPKYFGCLFSHGPSRDMRRDPLVHYYEPCVPRPEPRAPPSLPRGDRARTHARSRAPQSPALTRHTLARIPVPRARALTALGRICRRPAGCASTGHAPSASNSRARGPIARRPRPIARARTRSLVIPLRPCASHAFPPAPLSSLVCTRVHAAAASRHLARRPRRAPLISPYVPRRCLRPDGGCPADCDASCSYAHNTTEIMHHPIRLLRQVSAYLVSRPSLAQLKNPPKLHIKNGSRDKGAHGKGGGGSSNAAGNALGNVPGMPPALMALISLRLDLDGFTFPMSVSGMGASGSSASATEGGDKHDACAAPRGAFFTKGNLLPLALHEASSRHAAKVAEFIDVEDAKYKGSRYKIKTDLGWTHRWFAPGERRRDLPCVYLPCVYLPCVYISPVCISPVAAAVPPSCHSPPFNLFASPPPILSSP